MSDDSASAGIPSGVIEFLCPNGHRIRCSQSQAGRTAKCPRCQARFRVPESSEADFEVNPGGSGPISRPEFSDPHLANSANVAATPQEEQIEFLCPNGHRLNGPASLQGRPGQCPHCGAKFRIPSYDDIDEEEEVEQDLGVGRADGGPGSDIFETEEEEIAEAEPAEPAEPVEPNAPAGPVAMSEMLARLWVQKDQGMTIELHLAGGVKYVPDFFAADLSKNTYGVFAAKDPDGYFSLSLVSWDAVQRVIMRGLKALPREMAS